MNPTQFTGVCLITPDVPALRQFYEQILQIRGDGDETHVELHFAGANLTIFSSRGMEGMAPGSMRGAGSGSFTLEFQVDDVDNEAARLAGLGVPLVKPTETYPWGDARPGSAIWMGISSICTAS
jgi:uncharacterized glyoxalase superfamily protein PhnB